jgi:hypothetical protein
MKWHTRSFSPVSSIPTYLVTLVIFLRECVGVCVGQRPGGRFTSKGKLLTNQRRCLIRKT